LTIVDLRLTILVLSCARLSAFNLIPDRPYHKLPAYERKDYWESVECCREPRDLSVSVSVSVSGSESGSGSKEIAAAHVTEL
jgi:hypothetical protein